MNGVWFVVFVDGLFAGIAEREDYCADVADNFVNGVRKPLMDDDYPDRVWYHKIDVNRWYQYDQYNCSDKLSDDNIMCKNDTETEKCVKILNKLSLELEREQARLRALQL